MKIFTPCLYCGVPIAEHEREFTDNSLESGYDCENCGFSLRIHKEKDDTIYWNPEHEKKLDDGVFSGLPGWWTDVPDGCLLMMNFEKI